MDKQDRINMIKGTSPGYDNFEHYLITRAGYYIGGFVEEWKWRNLEQFTIFELKEIYRICKNG